MAALVAGGLGAGVARAGGGPAPPVIREPFTALPCPIHPDTTIEVEGCQEMRILRTDRAIDAEVKAIFGRLPTPSARASFVTGEQSWLRYRQQSCASEAAVDAGGSAEPVALLTCVLRRNTSHLADLRAMKKVVSQR